MRKREWFDNESFWRELYPFLFSDQRLGAADEQVAKALALAQPPGKSVLDLCCGPGRCSIALAKRGFKVTAVDKTSFLLEHAKRRAKAAGATIEWVRKDMRDFRRPNSFALVLNMFTSFGYFADPREDLLVLRNVLRSLRPGGAFLMELLGKERLARILQPTTSSSLPDGGLLVERHEIYADWTRIRNEWLLIRKNRVQSFCFEHAVYSGLELRDRLASAGFVDIQLYGGLEAEPYGPDAERLVAVARKPA